MPTVGLLVDWLEDDYQNAVFLGVTDAARERCVHLVCFAGGVLDSPQHHGARRNHIYDLCSKGNVDALLVMSGTLGNFVGPERLLQFCERFRPLPMVSIAVRLGDIPSVLVDNRRGMLDAISHLIEQHGRRRIGFVRGPVVNEEAERRFDIYREVLAEHGIEYDENLTVVGDFQPGGGHDGVRLLLDERRVDVDAIVTANDAMALGVLRALEHRKRRVPDEIAVIGFDDIEDVRYTTPPLTTVSQPLYEQGRQALHLALAQLEKQPVPREVLLHTELVLRRSCGCFPRTHAQVVLQAGDTPPSWEAALLQRRDLIAAALVRTARAGFAGLKAGWEERLIAALTEQLRGDAPSAFSEALEATLATVMSKGGDLAAWQEVITTLRAEFLPLLRAQEEIWRKAEDTFQDARILVGNIVERAQAQQRLQVESWARTLSATGAALVTTFDEVALAHAVAQQFPQLDIRSCYLSLYATGSYQGGNARLILAYDDGHILQQEAQQVFPAEHLAPRRLLPTHRQLVFIVEPLFFKDDKLGFVLLEFGPSEGSVYEALRDQISAALKGAALVQEVLEANRERSRLLTDLGQRNHELEEANQALKHHQDELLSAEKMATIGRLTASIAHEMNTPLAAVRASLAELTRLIDEYAASVGDPEVTRDDHEEIVREMRTALELAGRSSAKAARFVRGVKTQTRNLDPRSLVRFDPKTVVEEALLLLTHVLRDNDCEAHLDVSSEHRVILGDPGRLAQVVTNLVTNAADACSEQELGSDGYRGHIQLTISDAGSHTELTISDDGPGMSQATLDQVFTAGYTTKSFGKGTGLGLAIVKELMAHTFGGKVDVASEVGHGTTFRLLLPRADLTEPPPGTTVHQ